MVSEWENIVRNAEVWKKDGICFKGKKNKCSFEHVEFKILLRHMTANTHKCCMFVVTVVDSKRELARDPEKVVLKAQVELETRTGDRSQS